MTACIGWHAEPACPVWGAMHGCRHPDGHPGTAHECHCGAWCRNDRRKDRRKDRSGRPSANRNAQMVAAYDSMQGDDTP